MESRGPLIVAGMHRSGTSFVASLLESAGVSMGDILMQPNAGNPLGYFESLPFVEFHTRHLGLMGYDGSGWGSPTALRASEEMYVEAQALLASETRPGPWGWKDPRTTNFLEFWAQLIPDARFVFIYRDPAEVVASLYRRGDVAIERLPDLAPQAWLNHNGAILRFARANRPRCLLANVKVIARDPNRFLRAVRDRLDQRVAPEAQSTFQPDHMHILAPDNTNAILLYYFQPEIERLFGELEAEADLAASVNRGEAPSTRKARQTFLGSWQAAALRREGVPDRAVEGTARTPSFGYTDEVRNLFAHTQSLSERLTSHHENLAELLGNAQRRASEAIGPRDRALEE